MKPHEANLTYHAATRTLQYGGLPVATGVDEEFGPLLEAVPDLVRVAIAVLYRAGDADIRERMAIDALKKAGVLP